MTLSIAVVCEAPADAQTGCDLADRVVCGEVDWIEEKLLEHLRSWRGFLPGSGYLLWKEVKHLARAHGIKIPHGFFDNEPAAMDAKAGRRVLRLLTAADHRFDVVILLRDDDGKRERKTGLEQARRESTIGASILIGLAHPMRESWVLAGFIPGNDHERDRLAELSGQLGFDPCQASDRLSPGRDKESRGPKCVLSALTGDDWDRQAACWRRTDLAVLRQRGQGSGLTHYLDEVVAHLVPVFRSHRAIHGTPFQPRFSRSCLHRGLRLRTMRRCASSDPAALPADSKEVCR